MYQQKQMGYQFIKDPTHHKTVVTLTKRTQLCHHSQVPPIEAYITVVEQASSKLPAQEAEEFRSDVNKLLKQTHIQHNNKCNINPTQCKALTQLKQDNSRVVLTADKGMAMVILDKEDYIQQGPGITSGHKHLQSSQKGSHKQTQKTN